jgi:hypothetical protein
MTLDPIPFSPQSTHRAERRDNANCTRKLVNIAVLKMKKGWEEELTDDNREL